ncbi:hypothetical protein [Pantoea sp. PNA 03-3]|uniref:hypothetical protein n=1 Tax=Pantoea sp. PNA 03-3 TaxID=2135460 RepID=UPI000D7598B2|nr:hypothetical protein [Pantoea sp. PNA 03-3]PXV76834.1 hypothetical protein C7433_102528 [Pantoea sp. PNA 03-3]
MDFKKNDFNEIYNQPTPDSYISQLGRLNYRNDDFVYGPLLKQIEIYTKQRGECKIIDVACSYGFNGRIAKYRIPYGNWDEKSSPFANTICNVIGIDVSDKALAYALKENYIDYLICQNLEEEELEEENFNLLSNTDLVVASGAFSYVGVKTFSKIYSHPENKADFIGWPTCSFDKKELLSFLEKEFDRVEIHPEVFPMRNFASNHERDSYFENLKIHNPEYMNKSHNALSVFQINAYGKR